MLKIQSEREETDAGNLQAKYTTGLYIVYGKTLWLYKYSTVETGREDRGTRESGQVMPTRFHLLFVCAQCSFPSSCPISCRARMVQFIFFFKLSI